MKDNFIKKTIRWSSLVVAVLIIFPSSFALAQISYSGGLLAQAWQWQYLPGPMGWVNQLSENKDQKPMPPNLERRQQCDKKYRAGKENCEDKYYPNDYEHSQKKCLLQHPGGTFTEIVKCTIAASNEAVNKFVQCGKDNREQEDGCLYNHEKEGLISPSKPTEAIINPEPTEVIINPERKAKAEADEIYNRAHMQTEEEARERLEDLRVLQIKIEQDRRRRDVSKLPTATDKLNRRLMACKSICTRNKEQAGKICLVNKLSLLNCGTYGPESLSCINRINLRFDVCSANKSDNFTKCKTVCDNQYSHS